MEKLMNVQKLPQTDSIQELAQFWDTHDLMDFEDQLEVVTEAVFERETVVQIHLQPGEIEVVRKVAKSRGVGDADVIREWVLERVHVL